MVRISAKTIHDRNIPVLETRRLLLRAPGIADAAAIAALANDRRIAENTLRIPHPYAHADALAFITAASTDDETVFLITVGGTRMIGACGISRFDGHQPQIGYWLGVPFWRQGYASEAASALIDHAFADLGCEALFGTARVSNPASRRVLEKCGFKWTGVSLSRIRALGSSAPVDRLRLDRARWASLKAAGETAGFVDFERLP